jgi:hypothetical protein
MGASTEVALFEETWYYTSIIGMMMYISANMIPDIAFAFHQAARFARHPRTSHAAPIKRITRYLKATKDKGLIMSPDKSLKLDYYVCNVMAEPRSDFTILHDLWYKPRDLSLLGS